MQHLTTRQLAKFFGISCPTVHQILTEAGCPSTLGPIPACGGRPATIYPENLAKSLIRQHIAACPRLAGKGDTALYLQKEEYALERMERQFNARRLTPEQHIALLKTTVLGCRLWRKWPLAVCSTPEFSRLVLLPLYKNNHYPAPYYAQHTTLIPL